jgi:hypothetical protein
MYNFVVDLASNETAASLCQIYWRTTGHSSLSSSSSSTSTSFSPFFRYVAGLKENGRYVQELWA